MRSPGLRRGRLRRKSRSGFLLRPCLDLAQSDRVAGLGTNGANARFRSSPGATYDPERAFILPRRPRPGRRRGLAPLPALRAAPALSRSRALRERCGRAGHDQISVPSNGLGSSHSQGAHQPRSEDAVARGAETRHVDAVFSRASSSGYEWSSPCPFRTRLWRILRKSIRFP
jgi:hypothetical protein